MVSDVKPMVAREALRKAARDLGVVAAISLKEGVEIVVSAHRFTRSGTVYLDLSLPVEDWKIAEAQIRAFAKERP